MANLKTNRTIWFALTIFLVTLIVYLHTLAPTITWRNDGADSGDLVTAAFTGGIPHPPGYPLYTLVASLFARLPVGEPAFGVGIFSALAAASAITLLFLAARAIMFALADETLRDSVAAIAALALAFAPAFWSQATIAEVNAFSAMLVASLLVVLFSMSARRLELAIFIFGISAAHHWTTLLLAPMAWWLLKDETHTRAQIFRAVALFIAPLLLYLVLPLRASANPPINWGNPQMLENFWWVVSAAPYQQYLFGLAPGAMLERVATAPRLWFDQFTIWGVALGIWGVTQMLSNTANQNRRRGGALLLGIALTVAYAAVYGSRDSYVYLLFAYILFAPAIACGIADVLARLNARGAYAGLFAVFLLLPIFNLATNFRAMNLSQDRGAFTYAESIIRAIPNDAVIITAGDEHLFALWYHRYAIVGESSRVVIVSRELLQYDWYVAQMRQSIPASDARLASIIDQSIANHRKVYATARLSELSEYIFQPQENLFLIERKR
jgi:hypothetical protein